MTHSELLNLHWQQIHCFKVEKEDPPYEMSALTQFLVVEMVADLVGRAAVVGGRRHLEDVG